MPPANDISSLPMLQLAVGMRLHEFTDPAEETFVRRVEEYVDAYRSWAPSRDHAVAKHLLETSNAFRVTVPTSPHAFDLAARSSWYFDEVIVEDPLASLIGQKSPWQFKSPPAFRTEVPEEWIRRERAVHVRLQLQKLWDLRELLASRTVILAGTPPRPLDPVSTDGESQHEPVPAPPELTKVARTLADSLAIVAHDGDRARVLAMRAGFPTQHLPDFKSSQVFWHDVVDQALHGKCSLLDLAQRAADEFPSNTTLRAIIGAISEARPTADADSYYDGLVARVLSERPFLDWLRSNADLSMIDMVPNGDNSRWQFHRAELNGVYGFNIHRDEPVGPGEAVKISFPHDHFLRRVAWPLGEPGVPTDFRHLLDELVRTYLQALGSTGATAIHLGMGILTKNRVERHLARVTLQGKGSADERAHLDVADSFHVAAPMFEHLTPPQLLALREQLPLAFRECRAKFASICRESHSIEEAQVTADAELLPLVRQLEGDLESLKAKTRIAGGGAAIVTVVGAIATSLLDTALIPATLLSGGSLMSFIHRYANKKAEEKKLRSRAALFLWEARNKADKSNS